jgi:hypothetical protein
MQGTRQHVGGHTADDGLRELGRGGLPGKGVACDAGIPGSGGGLDQLGQRPHGDVERGGVLCGLPGRRQRVGVPPRLLARMAATQFA